MTVDTLYGKEKIKGRVCSYCKILKSLDNYWFKHGGKSKALRYVCKECETIQKRHIKKLKEQNDVPSNHTCPICKKTEDQIKHNRFVCDHDHATGKFRGYLCNDCNVSLGILEDDPDRILRAYEYLIRNSIDEYK